MSDTPLLDELEKGPWPSFVKEFKKLRDKKPMVNHFLLQLEESYRDKLSHWKHGGIVGVFGYGGGVIGRYSDLADKYPDVAHFHTMRVNHPAGWFYTSDALRVLCDIWDKHGSGMTNMHGSTGDIIFLGCRTEDLEPCFKDLTEAGFDLGGSGSDVRTPSCCCGQARCEWACYDSMGLTYAITQNYQDELHRPAFPYKFKFKMAGCPNDCVASVARSDMSVIGTWRDEIRVDQAEVKAYADGGLDIVNEVCMLCPTRCVTYKDGGISIDDSNCVKCMHCINVMPKALRPGVDKGATMLLGAKAPIVEGALLSMVLVPFIKLDTEDDFESFYEIIERLWDFWDEHGKNRERIGELMLRVGVGNFLEAVELEPIPQMILHPRENPYVFYEEYFEEDDDE
jgi:dissimilatory sulfite reductase alpha subunit